MAEAIIKKKGFRDRKVQIPDNLGVKVGTAEQGIWQRVMKEAKVVIEQYNEGLTIQKGIVELAEKKIAEEIEKLK